MAKKNIVLRARLVKGPRWYIDFTRFDPETGNETRHRQDFDLNDIEDLAIRAEVGERLVKNIQQFIYDKPAKPVALPAQVSGTTVSEAVAQVLAVKMQLPRKNSRKSYKYIGNKLLLWCSKMHYAGLPIEEFTKKHARAYWNALIASGKYCGRTLNNYRVCLRTIWNVMIEDETVTVNPWAAIKPERVGEKRRRPFSDVERRTVAQEIEQTDYWMFRGVLLQFFCYIRPVELLRLRFRDFDFSNGLVTVQTGNAKSWKKRVATIPKSVIHYFIDGTFERYSANLFLFGRVRIKPGVWELRPSMEQMDDMRMYKRHRKVLERLRDDGRLKDIAGLSWYSWKDTGISMHTRKTSPVSTKDQAGHHDLSITSVYYHAEPVNLEYRGLENDLMV